MGDCCAVDCRELVGTVVGVAAHFRDRKASEKVNKEKLPLLERLPRYIIEGSKDGLAEDLTEILQAGLIPVVACCNDANGGTTVPYVSVGACQDLIPIAFPMWEMNGPLGVDTMVNGISVGRVGDCIRNTRNALLPSTLLYVHFTAGHGAGAEPEGAWWQWFAQKANGQGLLSQDDHWDDAANTAAGLTDTAKHLHGGVPGWEGLNLDNVAFEIQTTDLYHNGRTEAKGIAFTDSVLAASHGVAGFCDSGTR